MAGLVFSGTPLRAQLPTILQNNPAKTTVDRDQEDEESILVDDWQYNIFSRGKGAVGAVQGGNAVVGSLNVLQAQPQNYTRGVAGLLNLGSMRPMSVNSANLGFTVGGAMDTNNFQQNLENGYLPKLDSITYEGAFSNYYFDTGLGDSPCRELFCPSYAQAINRDLFSGETNYYLSVGLNSGLTEKSFQRKKLNLMVVLDISGSMGSPFDRYSYDPGAENKQEESAGTKMQLADQAIVAMMKHLKAEDRFGVVLFDNSAYLAKPLHLVGRTDMKAIARHVLDVTAQGGTNWSAGYSLGLEQFAALSGQLKDPATYENRIIFITDAMPNSGQLDKGSLFSMIKDASTKGIYTSVIGVGVDFNTDLVNVITRVQGANYFTIHNAQEFKKRLADEFDFMVTPLVFDLKLKLTSKDFTIEDVYGSPEADLATGEIMRINTLFPSPAQEQQVKGGVVLIKLKKTGTGNNPISLAVSYMDRSGKQHRVTAETGFAESENNHKEFFDNTGIRKAVVLSEYVSLVKNWIFDTRRGCNDTVKHSVTIPDREKLFHDPGLRPGFQQISTWERTSCPLEVSAGYRKFFTLFASHFQREMAKIGDTTLQRDLDVLHRLSSFTGENHPEKPVDDWQVTPRGRTSNPGLRLDKISGLVVW